MTPIVAYAAKATLWACLYAGLLGEGLARWSVLGMDATAITSTAMGGAGLFLVGVRLRLDSKLVKRERHVAYEEGYLHGLRDAVNPGPVPSPEVAERLKDETP